MTAAARETSTVTASALARLLGHHRSSVTSWAERLGCPAVRTPRGWRFDIAAVVRWREERAAGAAEERCQERILELEEALEARAASQLSTEGAARTRKRVLEARRLELEIQELEGELVRVAEVRSHWLALVLAARSRIRALPARAGREFGLSKSQVRRLLELVDQELTEIAGDGVPGGGTR